MALLDIDDESAAVLPAAMCAVGRLSSAGSGAHFGTRMVPEETAVALVYDGATEAVMMATPADFEDFAVGFSLSEGIIDAPQDIDELTAVPGADGVELRMWLAPDRGERHRHRRRRLAGPTGCGLCGVESLAAAMRSDRRVVEGGAIAPGAINAAVVALGEAQALKRATRATHAAALYRPGQGIVALREDVGRHNALDKLIGALARDGIAGSDGAVVITSRVSVEMVQKTAALGAPVLIAVSAPTALAIRTAEAVGLTLVAMVRDGGFEIFTHPRRVGPRAAAEGGGTRDGIRR